MQSHAIPPVVLSPAMARRLDATAKAPASSDAASPHSFQDVLSLSPQARNVVENEEETGVVISAPWEAPGPEKEIGVVISAPWEGLGPEEEPGVVIGPEPEETGVVIPTTWEGLVPEEGPDPA